MKRILGIMWVFLFFVSLLTSIKQLDNYSRLYESCARAWSSDLDQVEARPDLRAELQDELARGKILEPSGKACPKLLPTHEKMIARQLASIK